MARAYASAIIKAPVETVWSLIRNFNGLPDWVPIIADSKIEGGLDAGCGRLRALVSHQGWRPYPRALLTLDDANHTFTYNFEKPAFPVEELHRHRPADAGDPWRPDLRRMGSHV